MSSRVLWLGKAERQSEDQLAYFHSRGPRASADLGHTVDLAIDRLAEFPHLGKIGRVRATRELVVSGTPFVIVYRIEPDRILILRVVHSAQRWRPG